MTTRMCCPAAFLFLVLLLLREGGEGPRPIAGGAAHPTVETEFAVFDLWVDGVPSGLGAWQIEVRDEAGAAKLVGVEGGDHAAYPEPPRFDPAALQGGRVVLAAFSTAGELPRGEVRVASLHYLIEGEPDLAVTLEAAVDADGLDLDVPVRLTRRN
ncbi:MAG: hypothetical protein R3F20_11110 [Planctomycetota bacterium]